jgi:hypothetical protein
MAHICPINGEKINEPTVRTVAGIVVILASVGIYFKLPFIFVLLGFDFFVRGFYKKEYSFLRLIAIQVTNLLNFKTKLIDAAPKRFAAKIGFIFSILILALVLLHEFNFALIVAVILIVCAVLESVFGYCLGCQFYSIYITIKDNLQKQTSK